MFFSFLFVPWRLTIHINQDATFGAAGYVEPLDRSIQPEARRLRLGFWFRLK